MRGPKASIIKSNLALIILLFLNFQLSALAANWIYGTPKLPAISAYQRPDKKSNVLGKLSKGAILQIYPKEQNGFYAVYTKQAWKDSHYLWIQKDEVDFTGVAQNSSDSQEGSRLLAEVPKKEKSKSKLKSKTKTKELSKEEKE